MDGAAPESRQDVSLREKQIQYGTYSLSLHDALPISKSAGRWHGQLIQVCLSNRVLRASRPRSQAKQAPAILVYKIETCAHLTNSTKGQSELYWVCDKRSHGWRSARIETGRLAEGKTDSVRHVLSFPTRRSSDFKVCRSLAWPAHTGVFIKQSIAGEPPALPGKASTSDTCV